MIMITNYRLITVCSAIAASELIIQIIRSDESVVCPVCGRSLGVIGSRKRKFIEADSSIKILIIRRLRCSECCKIHHELPDILVPYKRHCYDTIENIVEGRAEETPCEDNTIRKIKAWWASMFLYFQSVINSLKAKYDIMFSDPVKPKEIVRAVANSNLWIHTRSACLPG